MNNFAPLEMSVRQGAKLWNIAPNTIYDRIRKKELQLNENGKITPSEMSRVFGSPRPTKKVQWTTQTEPFWTVQISLLEQALQFEQQRNQDLQNRLTEATERIHAQEKQIFELLATIKDLSQGIKRLEAPKPRKKFLGIF